VGLVALPFLATVAIAGQPIPLSESQMDTVTAGLDQNHFYSGPAAPFSLIPGVLGSNPGGPNVLVPPTPNPPPLPPFTSSQCNTACINYHTDGFLVITVR